MAETADPVQIAVIAIFLCLGLLLAVPVKLPSAPPTTPGPSIADGLIALVTDMDEVYPELPHFALDDVAGLADFLLARKGEL